MTQLSVGSDGSDGPTSLTAVTRNSYSAFGLRFSAENVVPAIEIHVRLFGCVSEFSFQMYTSRRV